MRIRKQVSPEEVTLIPSKGRNAPSFFVAACPRSLGQDVARVSRPEGKGPTARPSAFGVGFKAVVTATVVSA